MDRYDGSSIWKALSSYRYSFQSETELQEGIEKVLIPLIEYKREYSLGEAGRPDFFLPSIGVAIEVKIKFSRSEVLRQLHRYAKCEQIKSLILVTSRSCHGVPEYLNSKRVYALNVGRL